MKTKAELIEWYEQRLQKVRESFSGGRSCLEKERDLEYIACAKANLEAVKNGRPW